jgi:predicted RNA binding protein YcfA (HicA-like mRNA interferase family)
MPKILPLNFREVVSKLSKLWYEWPFYWGKHPIMKKNGNRIPVPKHGGKNVSQGVISCIIDQVWVSILERNNL